MPDPIVVEAGVIVPADAVEMQAVRASGPGGQNVNKVSSKVELRIDLDRIRGLDPAAMTRLRHMAAGRLDNSGRLRVSSQRTRDQFRNLQDARGKVRNWIIKAMNPPTRRVRTAVPAGARARRLEDKRARAARKRSRQSVPGEEGAACPAVTWAAAIACAALLSLG